jgi:hypothetical protein
MNQLFSFKEKKIKDAYSDTGVGNVKDGSEKDELLTTHERNPVR